MLAKGVAMRVGCYGLHRVLRQVMTWLAVLGVLGLLAAPVAVAATPTIRISTENTGSHVQTRVLRLFAERLENRLGGRVRVEVHDSATLFRDRDVVEAVAAGRVDMAAPGTWHLDRYSPDFGVFLLPMFYGRDHGVNYAVRDGGTGRALNSQLEDETGVRVLGRWIDLGEAHLFTRGVTCESARDIQGLRLRVAGGEGNAARIRALGAEAVIISWPDLPAALASGTIDGTLTSAGTIVSASLWEHGIDGACLDRQYFAQYVPIVSPRLWQRVPDDVRAAMIETWDGVVDEARAMAAEAQDEALKRLESEGVRLVHPPAEELARTRAALMAHQDDMVRALGLDPVMVDTVRAVLEQR